MDLWANVQKHKWTVPQGTLAPGGRVWGGSDAQWWDDFCQSNLSQMLILSLSTSTPLHKREMMVMLMKVELRFTVYLKREEGVRIHSVLFKLHLHLH